MGNTIIWCHIGKEQYNLFGIGIDFILFFSLCTTYPHHTKYFVCSFLIRYGLIKRLPKVISVIPKVPYYNTENVRTLACLCTCCVWVLYVYTQNIYFFVSYFFLLGLASVVTSLYLCLYYNIINAWSFWYLFNSFQVSSEMNIFDL